MKINKIYIKNIHSLKGEVSIDFTRPPLSSSGIFAITGDTGAGKTTILDAITLALYGKIHRNTEHEDIISWGTAESMAEVEFEVDQQIYLSKWNIRRARNRVDGNLQSASREIAIYDKELGKFNILSNQINAVNRKITEITGLDYNRFTKSVLLSQGDFAAFLKATERDRSDLLERITGTHIYSELSKAAHARQRQESEQLKNLENELKQLNILQDDEKQQLLTNKQTLNEQLAKLTPEVQGLRELIRTTQQYQTLQANLNNNKIQKEQAQTAFDKFQPARQQLNWHKAAQQCETTLLKYDAAVVLVKQLEERLATKQLEKDSLEISQLALETRQTQYQTEYNQLKGHWQRISPLLDQAIALDADLAGNEETLTKKSKDISVLSHEKTALETTLAQLLKEQTHILVDIQENNSQRTVYQVDSHLLNELSGINNQLQSLHSRKRTMSNLQQDIDNLQAQKATQEQAKQTMEAQLARLQKERQELGNQLQTIFPGVDFADWPQKQGDIRLEINQLEQQLTQLTTLRAIQLDINANQSAKASLQLSLNTLQRQIDVNNSEIQQIDNQIITLRERIKAQQAIYEQQLLIANYERDRHKLQPGQACPLCYATEHPFRDHQVVAYVDEAKHVLDELNHTLNTSQEKRNRAGTEQHQLRNELDRLNADNSRLAERDLHLSTTKQDLENQLSKIGLPVHAEISVLLSDNNSLINQLKTTLDEVNALALKHRSTDQDLNRLQGDELQISDSLTQTKARLDTNTAQWHQLHQDFTAQLAEAEAALLKYALSIDPNNCLGHVDELRMRYDRWQQLVDRAISLNQRANEIQQDMNLRKNSLNEKDMALTKLRQEQEQQQISIDEKKAARQALGVDDNPVAQRTDLTNQQQQKELALLNIRDQIAQLRENISAIQGVLDLTNRELPRARQDKMHDEIALQALLAQHGFAHLEALRSAFLSPDQALALEQTQEQHKNKLAALDTERKQYLTDLNVIGERNPEALPQLEASLTELEEQSTQLNREIGALEQLLRADQEAQVNSRQMLEQIAVQKKAEQRWKMLSEIMGSADGNKFRSFAQGLTLQHLVNLANNHLNTLSGRYFLQRKASGLELLIVDTFQADNKRSVNSLSGGETFLVSLALALGLSDMAGKQAAIQSLFIDEGFGTLDADALDMAIDTLENLQQTGKTIGIISHIQELKERIGTQIYIQKSSHGLSSYEIKS